MFQANTVQSIIDDITAIKAAYPALSDIHIEATPYPDGYEANFVGWHDDLTAAQVRLLEGQELYNMANLLSGLYQDYFYLSGDYMTGDITITV